MAPRTNQDVPKNPAAGSRRTRIVLLTSAVALLAVLCWVENRSLASLADTHATTKTQLEAMRQDVHRIRRLRAAPKAAVGKARASEYLLALVERSLAAAGINRGRWHDSIPQPPVREPNSDYKRLSTRLYFAAISLRQLATFSYYLQKNDPSVGLASINLTNRQPETPDYDVDVAVSYLVYAPSR